MAFISLDFSIWPISCPKRFQICTVSAVEMRFGKGESGAGPAISALQEKEKRFWSITSKTFK